MYPSQKHLSFNSISWKPGTKQRLPLSGEVHLWKAALDASDLEVSEFWEILSEEEQERAKRFHFKKDRMHFIKSRGILKTLLGNYLSLAPSKIKLDYTKFGKPFLSNNSLNFNIAHSGGHGLFAFTTNLLIGVDLEKIKLDFDLNKLANRFFSKPEAELIFLEKGVKQANSFFKCWTRKEAFIKAHGAGLSIPLDQFEVSIKSTEDVQIKFINWEKEKAENWSMVSFEPEVNWIGALAVKGRIEDLCFYAIGSNES